MNPTKMSYDMFIFFLTTLLSNYMKKCKIDDKSSEGFGLMDSWKGRFWTIGPGDIVPDSLEKYKKNSKKNRNRSPTKQLKQKKKLVKPVYIFFNNHPEDAKWRRGFVKFNWNAFVPKFILNDNYLSLDNYLNLSLFKKGIFMENDCCSSDALKGLYKKLDAQDLELDSSGNVILTEVLESLKKAGLVTIVRYVYTNKRVSRTRSINPDGTYGEYKSYNQYDIQYEIIN